MNAIIPSPSGTRPVEIKHPPKKAAQEVIGKIARKGSANV
ncbi:unknown [Dialister sp. CAG:588]|nr:unknown [Dialister sp. CAG:588]